MTLSAINPVHCGKKIKSHSFSRIPNLSTNKNKKILTNCIHSDNLTSQQKNHSGNPSKLIVNIAEISKVNKRENSPVLRIEAKAKGVKTFLKLLSVRVFKLKKILLML